MLPISAKKFLGNFPFETEYLKQRYRISSPLQHQLGTKYEAKCLKAAEGMVDIAIFLSEEGVLQRCFLLLLQSANVPDPRANDEAPSETQMRVPRQKKLP